MYYSDDDGMRVLLELIVLVRHPLTLFKYCFLVHTIGTTEQLQSPRQRRPKPAPKCLGNHFANQLTSSYADLLAEIKSKQARLLESGQVDQSKSGSDEDDSDKD